jgi:riboflavin synthase
VNGSRREAIMRLMFTGLVEEIGFVEAVRKQGTARRTHALALAVKAPLTSKDAKVGDSISVSGCCLTVVKKSKNVLHFDVGGETLSCTMFARLENGDAVNLERSVQLGDRLGGHLVTGHIDGVGRLIKRRDEKEWSHFTFLAPSRLLRQMAGKGSIAVDGVSLTIVAAEIDRFSVALIPYTLDHTTLGKLQVGEAVNLETDLLAKYVERQLESRATPPLESVDRRVQ